MNAHLQRVSMAEHNNPLQQRLGELAAEYAAALPSLVADLESAWARLLEEWDPPALRQFARQAHSLIGSAGTLGFHAVSALARELEEAASAALNMSAPPASVRERVAACFATLREEVRRLRTPTPLAPARTLQNRRRPIGNR